MLFPEEDSPVLKEWIVKRLENTSDADADVLADYVLALLHNANDGDNIQGVFEEEITPFLKEDTKLFADDLIQTVKYRSYVPGAPPPPKPQPGPVPPLSLGGPSPNQPPFPTGPAAGGLKRGFHDRGDFDAPNGREQFQGGGRSFKVPRRGGGLGRRGYVDPDAPQPVQQMQYDYPNVPGQIAPPFAPAGPPGAMPNFLAATDPMEAMRQLQQLSQQIGQQMAQFPGYGQQQGYASHRPPQKKRGRCRDYDTKGYCARGPNCKFEHSNGPEPAYNLPAPQMSGQIQFPAEGRLHFDFQNALDGDGSFASYQGLSCRPFNPSFSEFFNAYSMLDLTQQQAEYDPTNATMMASPAVPQFPQQQLPQQQPYSGHSNQRRDNRQGQNQRRAGPPRAPFSASGPVHDRTQTKVVIESIPEENFDEKQVRDFFSQYGNIEEITMMPYKRLAIVKYDNWASANAAYKSPKVIFDNRFVKVFWYKDEKHADLAKDDTNGVKNGAASANGPGGASAEDQEEEIDMEEFTRKQEEAQKAHEEKMRKNQELARRRAELEKQSKELQAKHEAEKQRLLAKLANSGKNSSEPGANGTGADVNGGDVSKSTTQTEALRATLAKLQEEAKAFGLDPHAQAEDDATISMYAPGYNSRGRGGYYRGRGSYAPRASFRGGRGGRGNIHAAYAAFSLDNRPKKVAMSGVDFSAPEKDEALRQHLFSLGEFAAEIQVTPAVTHIGFNNRAAADKFYHSISNKTLPGFSEGEEVELSWVANTAGPLPGSSTHKVDFTSNHANGGGAGTDDFDSLMTETNSGAINAQNGSQGGAGVQGHGHSHGHGQQEAVSGGGVGGEVDYDVAGDNEWDID